MGGRRKDLFSTENTITLNQIFKDNVFLNFSVLKRIFFTINIDLQLGVLEDT